MNPQKKVKCAFNGKFVPISSMIKDVKFPPRCIADSSDSSDCFDCASEKIKI